MRKDLRRIPMSSKRQRGVSLLVVLMLLLVVTILGLAAMRGTLMQERMAANAVARADAFQVAEAVLREAEGHAASKPSLPNSGCVSGACAQPKPPGSAPAWQASGFWDTAGGYKLSNQLLNDIRAKYVVEDFGSRESTACVTASIDLSAPECNARTQVYRITVRSKADNGAEVLLQSFYEVP